MEELPIRWLFLCIEMNHLLLVKNLNFGSIKVLDE